MDEERRGGQPHTMLPGLTTAQLRQRVQSLESAVRQANGALDAANARAALAEKSARDAWEFNRALRSSRLAGRPLSDGSRWR
jgi:hypothetical protein